MIPLRNLKRFFRKALRQPFYAVRVAAKRMSAYWAYDFGRGKSVPPEAVTFFLTRVCNLRCKMCGQWGDHGITKADDAENLKHWLTFEEIQHVVDSIRPCHSSVTLFGGEPFLHPNIISIIEYIKISGLHCLVITNGTLLERYAGEIVNSGLDELNVSIDGGRGLHDEIRGLPGIFDQIMAGIEKVNVYKKECGSKTPLINLQCTISKYNAGHLEQLLDVARQARADSLTFHNLIFLKAELIEKQKMFDQRLGCSSKDWEGFVFEPGIDPVKLYEKLESIRRHSYDINVDFYPNFSQKGLVEYYLNPDYLPSEYSPRCVSPWTCAYIFPEGDVRPCLNCTYSFGNVKTADFMKIWNSVDAVRYRETLKQEGIFPACRRCTELYRY